MDQGFVAFIHRIWGSALPIQLMRAILVAALFELLVFAISAWVRKRLNRSLTRDAHADAALRLERRRIVLGIPTLLVRAVVYCAAFAIILRIFRFRAEQDLYPVALALLVLVAVGAKQLLRDAFCGYMLHYDYLIAIGDEVSIGDRSGIVSQLSLRHTCLLARDGTEVWIPNSQVRTVLNQSSQKRRLQDAER